MSKRVANDSSGLHSNVGTRVFKAPEILGLIGDSDVYSNSVDIWSTGCVTYKVLTSVVPFIGHHDLRRFCSGRGHFP